MEESKEDNPTEVTPLPKPDTQEPEGILPANSSEGSIASADLNNQKSLLLQPNLQEPQVMPQAIPSKSSIASSYIAAKFPVGSNGLANFTWPGTTYKKWYVFEVKSYDHFANKVTFKLPNLPEQQISFDAAILKYKLQPLSICNEAEQTFQKVKSIKNAQKVMDYCENVIEMKVAFDRAIDYMKRELRALKAKLPHLKTMDEGCRRTYRIIFGKRLENLDLRNNAEKKALMDEIASEILQFDFQQKSYDEKVAMTEQKIEKYIKKFLIEGKDVKLQLKDKLQQDIAFAKKLKQKKLKKDAQQNLKKNDSRTEGIALDSVIDDQITVRKTYVHAKAAENFPVNINWACTWNDLNPTNKSFEYETNHSQTDSEVYSNAFHVNLFTILLLFFIISEFTYRIIKIIQQGYSTSNITPQNNNKKI